MGRRSHKQELHKKKVEISQTIYLPRSWDYYERFKQPYFYPFEFSQIEIKQSELGDIKINATLWDTAIVMSKFFELEIGRDGLKGKRIIELGSGVGLLGVVLSLLGADIIITEQKSMHGILEYNVKKNCKDLSKTKVQELWWGDNILDFKPPFDMIVGSDLIYEDHCIDLLLKSLMDLSSFHPKPKSKYSDIIDQLDENGNIPENLLENLKINNDNEEEEENDEEEEEEVEEEEKEEKEDLDEEDRDDLEEDNKKENIYDSNFQYNKEIKKKYKNKKIKEDDEELKGEDYLVSSSLLEPNPDTVIYLGYEHREMNAESIFMNKVNKYFHVETITTKHLNPGFSGVDIRILKMKKIKQQPPQEEKDKEENK
ncbi:hypothetical protein DICPUDRAFT_155371 [Dictyostelium purpureum]|uniref:Uncharacterized protein n=1 Tax=Dictyostelium purpureum TaxID=5786 RepID=F0ZTT8_DICPU|nr:uncharacterized protein DICPUDRAFT_155371 [Dictyostelium purpureum]EGC32664.1 hypothetical protein DICPUDRAFT_155371 [Dictyostelium purpureum]|eukprot:XP_003290833.1 hypothetical protein DICPUDRAFT_155371 [Dictyostelium purpureum]